jgi:uncharacterized protein (TIGR02145 family)
MKTSMLLTMMLLSALFMETNAQVGIGTTSPDASALLDVNSTTKGLLVPRMTQSQREAIASPAAGLLVYQTSSPAGYYYYNGSLWNLLNIKAEGSVGQVIDSDGNIYPTVVIGNQEWIAANLRVTHFRNGESIPKVTTTAAWAAMTTAAYCWYSNDSVANGVYGILYNWFTVNDSRLLCPDGWHVATNTEWNTLATYLGGATVAGGTMKRAMLWNSPNTGATNSSGFSGLPGGWRSGAGNFSYLGSDGYFWTATQFSGTGSYTWYLEYDDAEVHSSQASKVLGHSVRCIKD